MDGDVINEIGEILKENHHTGLTIIELVIISDFSRSAVRTALAGLEGAGEVSVRRVGMTRVYSLKAKKNKRDKILLFSFLVIAIFLIPMINASDVIVWQGQYYTGTTFNKGTYIFNFSVYDSLTDGDLYYSNTTMLTTGNWGEWKTEQYGVSAACNNANKNYFVNININGTDQPPRRRITMFNFLRKDAGDIISGDLIINGTLRGGSPLVIDDDINVKNIQSSGNISGNFYYGEMYLYNHSDLINIIFSKTWYNITNFTEGYNNGFSYSNSTLTALFDGVYRLEYNIISEGIKERLYYFAPALNGVIKHRCWTKIFPLKTQSMNLASNSCYVRLNTGDTLNLMVLNDLTAEDIVINEGEFNILRIGN